MQAVSRPILFFSLRENFWGKEKIVFISPLLSLRLLFRHRMPFFFLFLLVVCGLAV
jgi:hypothetical protein